MACDPPRGSGQPTVEFGVSSVAGAFDPRTLTASGVSNPDDSACPAKYGHKPYTLTWSVISPLEEHGLMPDNLAVLAPLTLLMSNTIGNVPSVILLLQIWPDPPRGALYALALLSTLAGNLLLVGSLANLIVVERAASQSETTTPSKPHSPRSTPLTSAPCSVIDVPLTT